MSDTNASMQSLSMSSPPTTIALGAFETYAEAQRVVDRLSDARFPVEHTTIVADGLHIVEQVTGRLNWAKALGYGVLNGALVGALVCWFISVFAFIRPLPESVSFVLVGAGVGAAIGAVVRGVTYLATGGERDFTSVSGMSATNYRVLCDAQHANRAREILDAAPTTTLSA